MAKTTNISWADSTASPWFGCTEVSPGCANCYAREFTVQKFGWKEGVMRRAYKAAGFADWETRPVWGHNATRVVSKGFWSDVVKWHRSATATGSPVRVFPSLMDWLDEMPAGIVDLEGNHHQPDYVLARFLQVVLQCDGIEWLLLTKRIGDWRQRLSGAADQMERHSIFTSELPKLNDWLMDGRPPRNVRVGVTVENQHQADERVWRLIDTPASSRFLSVEPLLERVDLRVLGCGDEPTKILPLSRQWHPDGSNEPRAMFAGIDWVIVGGESGQKFRRIDHKDIEFVAWQCQQAGVPVHVKQDCGLKPGEQGRIAPEWFSLKQYPEPYTITSKSNQ